MLSILALADDMTGALEVGAKFSAAGIPSTVRTEPVESFSEQAVVYDTETRHLTPAEAGRKVKRFVSATPSSGHFVLYKKTDSTLRGNIAAELGALAEIFPDSRIGYAPAYPQMGRTVRDGVLYVYGIALAETEFAQDLLNPTRDSSIAAVLPSGVRCTVFDGEDHTHVNAATHAMLAETDMRILAGPSALAEAIARCFAREGTEPPGPPQVRSCLVLNGSRTTRAALQMEHAEAPGWRAVETDHSTRTDAVEVAVANSKCALAQIRTENPDGIFVIGGDTAYALVSALGVTALSPLCEVVAGVPASRISVTDIRHVLPDRKRDLILITKAGGFGEPDVLRSVRQRLGFYAA